MGANFIKDFFDNIMLGNASYITSENITKLNNEAMRVYNLRNETLVQQDIEELKQILMKKFL